MTTTTDMTQDQACDTFLDVVEAKARARMAEPTSDRAACFAVVHDILEIVDGKGGLPRFELRAIVDEDDVEYLKSQGETWYPTDDLSGSLADRWDALSQADLTYLRLATDEMSRACATDHLLNALYGKVAHAAQETGPIVDVPRAGSRPHRIEMAAYIVFSVMSGSNLDLPGFNLVATAGSNFPTGDDGDLGGALRHLWARRELS